VRKVELCLADLNSEHEQALLNAMKDADATFQKARANYQQALEIATASGWSENAVSGLSQEGRDYAHALTHHTSTTMAWLKYVDTVVRTPKSKWTGGE